MSQSEVLKILQRLGGSATIDELAYHYNIEHFPRNPDYCDIPIVTVKKTMSHDITKLLRDHMITRTRVKKPRAQYQNTYNKQPTIKYFLTEFGKHQLSILQPLYQLQSTS